MIATTASPLATLERIIVTALLPAAAQAQHAAGAVSADILRPFAALIKDLSARYTTHRNNSIDSIDTIDTAIAYALYYTPINAAKVIYLLGRPSVLPVTSAALRILDFGAGPATAALAAASVLTPHLDIVAVDRSDHMRTIAGRLLHELARSRSLTWNVATDFSGQFDLIIAANVLNELSTHGVEPTLARLSGALTEGGTLITLEPALLETTRRHMHARDLLLERAPELTPVFPCTHRTGCSMLRTEPTNWCHAPLTWEPPLLVRQLDALTGFNKHRTKYSAFVFRRGAPLLPGIRLVSQVEKSRRGATAVGCGPGFYGPLELPKRDRTDSNRCFGRLGIYDRIAVDPLDSSGHIGQTTTVTPLE